jgi:RND family efflux transporter MFP subunit
MKILYFSLIIIVLPVFSSCNQAGKSEVAETHGESVEIQGLRLDTIRKGNFSFTLKTGGEILADNKNISVITAKSSGIVRFSDRFLFQGVKVNAGQILFTVSGENLAEDNAGLRFSQLEANLEKARSNYERAQKLLPDKIITEEHFLEIKNEYAKILSEYEIFRRTFNENASLVTSPAAGYIRELYVTEGQKVSAGDRLATIIGEHKIVLKALLSPLHAKILPSVESANFRVAGNNRVFRTQDLNGRKISYGKSTGENSFYIPVYFSMDYDPELIEGTFAEVWLKGEEIHDAITVPNSSLMEEFGSYYVFVKDDDGDFLKRYIKTGYSDGERTLVTEGLKENEVIAAEGVYQIKLKQMAGSVPAHTHNH